jgi:endonuclease YncB( thermonuclease family)
MAGPASAVTGFFGAMAVFAIAAVAFSCTSLADTTDESTADEPAADGDSTESTGGDSTNAPTAGDTNAGTAAAGAPTELGPDAVPANLVRVVDGDSLELEIDGDVVDVRLQGINAPELFGDDGATCNGTASKDALQDLVDGGELVVVGDEIDRFGRRLADVFVLVDGDSTRGTSVVETMIANGRGLATGDVPELRAPMKQAAGAGVGLWGDGCGTGSSAALFISDSQVDPPGADRDNLNDEWVVIANASDSTVDLTGWVISDDTTGHRFPLDGALESGAELVVRTGAGARSDGNLHLGETFPVWSNRGETVLLTDPTGVVSSWAFIDP